MEPTSTPPDLPARPHDGHKGIFGRLLVVGGTDEMIGAPILAGMAALRMGAGLVQVAMPRPVLATALSICPELIGLGLSGPADMKRLLDAAHQADAIVIGPGLGESGDAKERLKALVSVDRPMVVDADGLNILSRLKSWPGATFKARAALTPHPGEMRRLAALLPIGEAGAWLGAPDEGGGSRRDWESITPRHVGPIPGSEESRIRIATAAARIFNQCIVLKGHRTVVTDARQLYINTTGDSTLAKAGSGDVLSGIIGALLAQGMAVFDAAALGAHVHGKAGALAGEEQGQRSPLARDVIGMIAHALSTLNPAVELVKPPPDNQ